jgi:glycerophosphoryl diester phosphodiesterase
LKTTPWVIAHRGANKQAPENTRSAFDIALSYAIDGLETDVQMTGDGIPVLYHDRTLFKIMGKRKRISDLTYQQLCELNQGRWHSRSFVQETFLTLDETLKSYAHRTRLMIEIKSHKPDQISGRSLELTLKVLEEIRKPQLKNYLENIFILSFDPVVLRSAHDIAPDLKYVLNLSDKANDPTGYVSIRNSNASDMSHLYGLCAAVKNLSEDLTAFAHDHQKKMMTYVCNTERQVKRALNLNADVIMTDHPGWLTKYLFTPQSEFCNACSLSHPFCDPRR